ncbi:MAG: GTPase HflX [Oscillospiraceae bacterium]|nr:GTPase HflX [Oscillospiraceae bacterium]
MEKEKKEQERAILISVNTGAFNAVQSLEELERLADTAGAIVVGKMMQPRSTADRGSFLGTGKVEELRRLADATEANLIIADDELSPSQQRNLEDALELHVIDRTVLILDIFAARAQSAEGRLQVEMAQLKYLLPRLRQENGQLSRLGGGIGTRGPGETKLESDRRHIRTRMHRLALELESIEQRRSLYRQRRRKLEIPTVAIVGYTNAGKSTLLNTLTNAGVLAENQLFATLDPTARALLLPQGRKVMLVDTVGLVRRLPHDLVRAFHATLEEATEADLILQVSDLSAADCADQAKVVTDTLEMLRRKNKPNGEVLPAQPVVHALNKADIAPPGAEEAFRLAKYSFLTHDAALRAAAEDRAAGGVRISAKTGEGLKDLLLAIEQALPPDRQELRLTLPLTEQKLLAQIQSAGKVLHIMYYEDCMRLTAVIPDWLQPQVTQYITPQGGLRLV